MAYEAWEGSENKKAASLLYPHCPLRKSGFLIRCLSSLNLLMSMALPGLPSDRSQTFHPNHGESPSSPNLSASSCHLIPCWWRMCFWDLTLACYLSTSWYSIVLFRCHVGHRAFLCDVCSLLDYTLGNEAHAHSVLLSFKTISITLLPLPRPGGISQRILQLISLNCSFPHIVGLLSSFGKKKKFLCNYAFLSFL